MTPKLRVDVGFEAREVDAELVRSSSDPRLQCVRPGALEAPASHAYRHAVQNSGSSARTS